MPHYPHRRFRSRRPAQFDDPHGMLNLAEEEAAIAYTQEMGADKLTADLGDPDPEDDTDYDNVVPYL